MPTYSAQVDIAVVDDSKVGYVIKDISDTIVLTETRLNSIYRVFAETYALTDDILRKTQKLLTEVVAADDTLTRLINLYRMFTETLILTDIIHGVGKDIVATGILDAFKKTHKLALPVKRMILKRRI